MYRTQSAACPPAANSLDRCRRHAASSTSVVRHARIPLFGLELKAQLRAFLVGQPVRHLRKDGAVKPDGLRLPWKLLRRAGFGENLVEFGAHGVGIGSVLGRGC